MISCAAWSFFFLHLKVCDDQGLLQASLHCSYHCETFCVLSTFFFLSGMHNTYLYVCFWLSLSTLCLSFLHPWHCSLSLLTRYSGEPGRKGAPALHNDHPADQPARAAPGCPRRTEEARRLTNGETEAANGVSSSAAGAGNCSQFFFSHIHKTTRCDIFSLSFLLSPLPFKNMSLSSFNLVYPIPPLLSIINPIKYICNKLSLVSQFHIKFHARNVPIKILILGRNFGIILNLRDVIFYITSDISVMLLHPHLCLRGRKNVIMTYTNKCKGMWELNVILNMEVLYIL